MHKPLTGGLPALCGLLVGLVATDTPYAADTASGDVVQARREALLRQREAIEAELLRLDRENPPATGAGHHRGDRRKRKKVLPPSREWLRVRCSPTTCASHSRPS